MFYSQSIQNDDESESDKVSSSHKNQQSTSSKETKVFFPRLKQKVSPPGIEGNDTKRDKQQMTGVNGVSASTVKPNLDSYSIAGFLHQEQQVQEERVRRDWNLFLRVPESRLLPSSKGLQAHNDRQYRRKQNRRPTRKAKQSAQLTSHDNEANTTKTKKDERAASASRKFNGPKGSTMISPYQRANRTISRVLKKKLPSQYKEEMKSKRLESQILLYRSEIEAAMVLQLMWRRHMAKTCLYSLKLQKVSATMIQCNARGMLTRRWYFQWKKNLAKYATLCQAQVRSRIIRSVWNLQKEREYRLASTIQRAIRCYLAKKHLCHLRLSRCASLIENLYRGWKCRKQLIRMRMNASATCICSASRRFLARKVKNRVHAEKSAAVTVISRCWRSHRAKSVISEVLYEQIVKRRQNQILLLASEVTAISEEIARVRCNVEAPDLMVHHHDLEEQAVSFVGECEKNLSELLRLQLQVSPQSVQGGWLEQTTRSIKEKKEGITKTKLDIIFNKRKESRARQQEYSMKRERLRTMEAKKEAMEKWIDALTKSLWKYKREYDVQKRMITLRRNVALERNKWLLLSTNHNGKPNKSLMRSMARKRNFAQQDTSAKEKLTTDIDDCMALIDHIHSQTQSNRSQEMKSIIRSF